MSQRFYSNGKLLLSGEYAVLNGALAWAIPTKFGQSLTVENNNSSHLLWKSYDKNNHLWFEGTFDLATLKEISASNQIISKALQKVLIQARKLNPLFLSSTQGCAVKTQLTFHKDWGLGSSSTLLNNISYWASVDPFELSRLTFGGSGYDIACAQHNSPILYQLQQGLPQIEEINRHPSFSDSLNFIYLNKKQNSREAIAAYKKRGGNETGLVNDITQITKKMISCASISDFERLITVHENILSEAMGIPTVKSRLFPDYQGAIKSLGAWGGDFILATSRGNTSSYFNKKGYHTIVPYEEMIR